MSFAPVYNEHSRALILGTWPSPKSREQGFFYGHPQNRFWPMMAALTGEPVPKREDIEAKKQIILRHGLAQGAYRVSPRGIQGRIQFDNSFCQISRNFSGLQAALAGLVLGSTTAGRWVRGSAYLA